MKNLASLPLFACGLLFTCAGCGGSGSSSSPNTSGGAQTTKVGPVSATFTGTVKPLVSASSSAVNITGIAGANFTSLITRPTQSLNNTFLAATIGRNLWTTNYGTGVSHQLTTDDQAATFCSIAPNGQIAFDAYDAQEDSYIAVCNADGRQSPCGDKRR